MKMALRNHIAPRVQVMNLRSRYTGQPLSKDEVQMVLCALQETGISDCFNRLMDDSARLAIDEILELI
jgi:hypothetical protein